eukprot:gene1017-1993_t
MPESDIECLNSSSKDILKCHFTKCCGSALWVNRMLEAKPFLSIEDILNKADIIWWSLSEMDWNEAFAAHPRIGDRDALRKKFSQSSWEGDEQKGANNATEKVLEDLERGNIAYEKKFGYIFLICATGKSAEEMLTNLQERLNNDVALEIRIAAEEQSKIIKLRIIRLLSSLPSMSKFRDAWNQLKLDLSVIVNYADRVHLVFLCVDDSCSVILRDACEANSAEA